jgi:hypothetical protein
VAAPGRKGRPPSREARGHRLLRPRRLGRASSTRAPPRPRAREPCNGVSGRRRTRVRTCPESSPERQAGPGPTARPSSPKPGWLGAVASRAECANGVPGIYLCGRDAERDWARPATFGGRSFSQGARTSVGKLRYRLQYVACCRSMSDDPRRNRPTQDPYPRPSQPSAPTPDTGLPVREGYEERKGIETAPTGGWEPTIFPLSVDAG